MAEKKDNKKEKRSSLKNAIRERFFPALDKLEEEGKKTPYYKLKKMKKKLLPKGYGSLRKFTPEQHNKAWKKFNQSSEVRKLQNKIMDEKVKERTKK